MGNEVPKPSLSHRIQITECSPPDEYRTQCLTPAKPPSPTTPMRSVPVNGEAFKNKGKNQKSGKFAYRGSIALKFVVLKK
jgi:hypothetical protein